MAQNDVTSFDQMMVDSWEGVHNLETNAIMLGLTDGSTVPATTTADPRWGASGTTNFAAEQITPGGNYSDGGAACANPTVTLNAGACEFDADDPAAWAQNASNPTDATYGIYYNDTAAGKNALASVDLGGSFDMTTGDLTVVNGAPIFTWDQT